MIKAKNKTTSDGRVDIIEAILSVDYSSVKNAVESNPNAINAVHEDTGMNAAMLSVAGALPSYFDLLIETSGVNLDFSHRDHRGRDLLTVAFGTLNSPLIDRVQAAYERLALHEVNNFPSP